MPKTLTRKKKSAASRSKRAPAKAAAGKKTAVAAKKKKPLVAAKKSAAPIRAKAKAPAAAAKKAAPAATRQPMRMPPPDDEMVAALDRALGEREDLRRGKMFGCPGYFVGTKAVASVVGPDICVTLPVDEIEQRVAQPGFRRFLAFGRTMSGWLLLDKDHVGALVDDPSLLAHAVDYARSKSAPV